MVSKEFYLATGRRKNSVARVFIYPVENALVGNTAAAETTVADVTAAADSAASEDAASEDAVSEDTAPTQEGAVEGAEGTSEEGAETAAEEIPALGVSESLSEIEINGKAFEDYFPVPSNRVVVVNPLKISGRDGAVRVKINVHGGGKSGQSGAIALGLARALEKLDPEVRSSLKKAGCLTRDPRIVERKKPGRHKARKKPQFSKR